MKDRKIDITDNGTYGAGGDAAEKQCESVELIRKSTPVGELDTSLIATRNNDGADEQNGDEAYVKKESDQDLSKVE